MFTYSGLWSECSVNGGCLLTLEKVCRAVVSHENALFTQKCMVFQFGGPKSLMKGGDSGDGV